MEEILSPVVRLKSCQALDAGHNVGHEGGHRHIVQTLELPDKDFGNAVESSKDQDQRTNSHQEPWENTADDTQAEENQDHVLDKHFCLEGETSVHWKETETP